MAFVLSFFFSILSRQITQRTNGSFLKRFSPQEMAKHCGKRHKMSFQDDSKYFSKHSNLHDITFHLILSFQFLRSDSCHFLPLETIPQVIFRKLTHSKFWRNRQRFTHKFWASLVTTKTSVLFQNCDSAVLILVFSLWLLTCLLCRKRISLARNANLQNYGRISEQTKSILLGVNIYSSFFSRWPFQRFSIVSCFENERRIVSDGMNFSTTGWFHHHNS